MKDWFTDDDGTVVLRPGDPKAKMFLYVLLGAVLLVVVITGRPWFTVSAKEKALVLRFGEHVRTVGPGLHFRWPWPIETVEHEQVEEIKRLEMVHRVVREKSLIFSKEALLLWQCQNSEQLFYCHLSWPKRLESTSLQLIVGIISRLSCS